MNSELLKPFNLCFKILKFLGLWQDGLQSSAYRIIGYLSHFAMFELCIVGQVLYMINADRTDEKIEDWIDSLRIFIVCISLVARSFNFIAKIDKISKAVKAVNQMTIFTDPLYVLQGHALQRAKIIVKVIKIYWLCAGIFSTFSIIAGIISHQILFKIWLPFDAESCEACYWIETCFLTLNISYVTSAAVALDMLPLAFICFVVGLVEELSDRLAAVTTNEELIKCIQFHIEIKEFVKKIHANFAAVILLDGFVSSTVFCVCAFLMSMASLFVTRKLLSFNSLTFCVLLGI